VADAVGNSWVMKAHREDRCRKKRPVAGVLEKNPEPQNKSVLIRGGSSEMPPFFCRARQAPQTKRYAENDVGLKRRIFKPSEVLELAVQNLLTAIHFESQFRLRLTETPVSLSCCVGGDCGDDDEPLFARVADKAEARHSGRISCARRDFGADAVIAWIWDDEKVLNLSSGWKWKNGE
jgi:hypothetical protein